MNDKTASALSWIYTPNRKRGKLYDREGIVLRVKEIVFCRENQIGTFVDVEMLSNVPFLQAAVSLCRDYEQSPFCGFGIEKRGKLRPECASYSALRIKAVPTHLIFDGWH